MDFALSDEQLMIQESAAGFLAKASDSAAVRAAMERGGYSGELWRQIAGELCWPALIVPEQHGGLALGFVEQAILLEQMGRRLLGSPFFASACLAIPALLLSRNAELQARLLPELASGSLTATLACSAGSRAGHLLDQNVQAVAEGDGWRLDGVCDAVVDGAEADLLIVAARLTGTEGASIGLFAVPANGRGISREALPTLDQTRRLGRVVFGAVQVSADDCLHTDSDGAQLLEQTLQLGAIALACEQTGSAQQCLDLTLAYLNERQQFGRPIASFQAIKHRCADLMLEIESARSACYYAACVAREALDPAGDRAIAAELGEASAIAKIHASEAFMHCAEESIQLHGGVGFTWEYDPHLYFKRARAGEQLLGTPAQHRERLAHLILEQYA
ncbi:MULTISPECIES: acyl-CoA dehydrogenase family protein [Pseudomonadaceae]|jgi:alkylation response protein AidB-like acyl-CoA dehydrogenase|uniref:acyl-CoA dehydrogenase family protein n=1 Tax=Pseudomonadaceae TaxID=135621 RepID=UPI002FD0655F